MAKIYGQLEKAQLELLAGAPADAPTGYVFYDTSSDQMKFKTPSGFSTVVSKGLPPIGTIVAWLGGYMTGSSNESFTSVLGNNINAVNAIINGDGYYVCDGSAINLPGSPIYNAPGRYLPNLTNSRFLQGSTAGGAIGGENSVTLSATNLPGFSVTTNPFAGVSSTTAAASTNHTHPVRGSTVATIGRADANGVVYIAEDATDFTSTRYIRADDGADRPITTVGVALRTVENSISTLGSTAGPSASVTLPTTSNIPSHTHTITTGPSNGGMNGTPLENRPSYLSVFYIKRVI